MFKNEKKKKKEPAKLIEIALGNVAYFSPAASHLAHPTLFHFPSAPSLFFSYHISSSTWMFSPCSPHPSPHVYFLPFLFPNWNCAVFRCRQDKEQVKSISMCVSL